MTPHHCISKLSHISLVPSVVFTVLPGETVILDPNADVYFSLTGTGVRVWELLGSSPTLDIIVTTLIDEFDVDAATCEHDVRALLNDLAERGLVVVTDLAGLET